MQTLFCVRRCKISKVFSGIQVALGMLVVLLSLASLLKFYSAGFFLNDVNLCNHFYAKREIPIDVMFPEFSSKLQDMRQQIEELQSTIEITMEEIRKKMDSDESRTLNPERLKVAKRVAEILDQVDSIKRSLVQIKLPGLQLVPRKEDFNIKAEKSMGVAANTTEKLHTVVDFFYREEIRKYITVRENRLGKKNFLGANGTFTSIGHACLSMKEELEEYMNYDIGDYCKDDWNAGQKLMVHGCDPLPRRRCLARAPRFFQKPLPIDESLWTLPDDRNVRWNNYRCKNFTCLISNTTQKGFYKCVDCFNLADNEKSRWMNVEVNNSYVTTDFLIEDVLGIKPGEVRIGLDFSVGTGTFAARMKEFNVTIVSATLNLGAPFNEMIALRGLVPLYITINQRLPFFDNTLDLIHTARFLDGWIDLQFLDFIVFDWDRVLRPGGFLWIDNFFCAKDDIHDYMYMFLQLRYKKHRWAVSPKVDKDANEVYFSAVLEKPPRPF